MLYYFILKTYIGYIYQDSTRDLKGKLYSLINNN